MSEAQGFLTHQLQWPYGTHQENLCNLPTVWKNCLRYLFESHFSTFKNAFF
eukprot:UN17796